VNGAVAGPHAFHRQLRGKVRQRRHNAVGREKSLSGEMVTRTRERRTTNSERSMGSAQAHTGTRRRRNASVPCRRSNDVARWCWNDMPDEAARGWRWCGRSRFSRRYDVRHRWTATIFGIMPIRWHCCHHSCMRRQSRSTQGTASCRSRVCA